MQKKLQNKVAIVTGASKGIGSAIAEELAAQGASVVVNYATSKEGALRAVDAIEKKGGKAVAIQADVAKPEDIDRLMRETREAFGHLDILVNNAGIYDFQPLENITPEHFHKHFNTNVLGLLLTSKAAVSLFGPNGGSIINIGSVAGSSHAPQSAVYSATKAAVDSITRVLAHELGPRKIRVNTVNPGMVKTEGTVTGGFVEGDFESQVLSATPLQRIGVPRDIAPAVAFLASDDASWITAEALFISGGYR